MPVILRLRYPGEKPEGSPAHLYFLSFSARWLTTLRRSAPLPRSVDGAHLNLPSSAKHLWGLSVSGINRVTVELNVGLSDPVDAVVTHVDLGDLRLEVLIANSPR